MTEKRLKFIARLANRNSGYDYDFSNTPYGTRMEKVEVVCNVHGAFTKSVQQLERGLGCPTCVKASQRSKAQEQFISKGSEHHKSKYDYSKVAYVTNKHLVIITCPNHGDFTQSPDSHLAGHGCRECQYEELARMRRKSQETFIAQAVDVHGDVYDYSLVQYVNSNTKVKIILPSGEVAEQLPSHHLSGCRPSTERRGLDYASTGILYYLRIVSEDRVLYKVGVTSRDVQARFSASDLSMIEVLYTETFKSMRDAFDKEQSLLKYYKNYQYTGPDILASGGNTELFTVDVLGLDKGNKNVVNTMGE